jgi:hypothetical protein
LIYVVDIDLGLYILRYTGPHAAEVAKAAFVEGNSSPSRYSAKAPLITRPATQWATIAKQTAAHATHEVSPYLHVDRQRAREFAHEGFLCM